VPQLRTYKHGWERLHTYIYRPGQGRFIFYSKKYQNLIKNKNRQEPFLLDRKRRPLTIKTSKKGNIFLEFFRSIGNKKATWPKSANFRLLCECLLWAAFWTLQKKACLVPWRGLWINFCQKWVGLHFGQYYQKKLIWSPLQIRFICKIRLDWSPLMTIKLCKANKRNYFFI
jgi:hypothetical protein